MTDLEQKVAADEAKAAADFTSASGWIKVHVVWLIGLGCFVAGAIVGHFA
jgi:hypothetical protein